MATTVSITPFATGNVTRDRTPRFTWTFTDSGAPRADGGFRIKIFTTTDGTNPVTPLDTVFPGGNTWHTVMNANGQSLFDLPVSLAASATGEQYLVELQAYDKTLATWSASAKMAFTVIKTTAHLSEADVNNALIGTPAAVGFEDFTLANTTASTNPERLHLYVVTPGSRTESTLYLLHDSGVDATVWGTVSWESLEPDGTRIAVNTTSGDTNPYEGVSPEDVLFTVPAAQGTPLGIIGRYLAIAVTLTPDATGTVAPHLYTLQLVYQTPATTEDPVTVTYEANPNADPVEDDFRDTANVFDFDGGKTRATATGVELGIAQQISQYTLATGSIVFRHDAFALADYDALRFLVEVPSDAAASPKETKVEIRYRAFNKTKQARSARWSTPVVIDYATQTTATPTEITVPLTLTDKRFVEVRIDMATTNVDLTPLVRRFALDWRKTTEPTIAYLFLTEVSLPSNIAKTVISSLEDDPEGCWIDYAISSVTPVGSTPKQAFDGMQKVEKDAWIDSVLGAQPRVTVAARLVAGSRTAHPSLKGLSYRVYTVDNDIEPLAE